MTRTKRVTAKQLVANRANAQKSTGPRTPQGRAASRWNALQHGVLARALIPPVLEPYESREEFAALLQTLRQELAPQSALEEILVERIATSYWRLARLLRAEAGTIAHRQGMRDQDMAGNRQLQAILAGVGGLRMNAPDPINELTYAMGSAKRLRAFLAQEDERWRTAPEDDLLAAAEERLAGLHQQRESREAQAVAIEQAQRSIPPLKEALPFARYEAALERQIYRALAALERVQRLRAGEPVPPTLNITVDMESPGRVEL